MTNYYFSPSTLAFYPSELIEEYKSQGTLPDDIQAVTDDVFVTYSGTPREGKMRGVSEDGLPAWVDIPPPTQEQVIAAAEALKTQLRLAADSEIAWLQDSVDAGIATDEETAALSDWKTYRILLMRVDTAKPVWPTPPGEQASQD